MDFRDHARTTGSALKNWFIAQTLDSLAVAALWLVGLLIIGVPWAPLWAVLAFILQYVPQFGAVIAVIGPAAAALFGNGARVGQEWWEPLLYVLILYAIIVVVDGLVLQPYFMRRTSRVPIWASILVPLVLGFLIPFWGLVLAPPLLAIYYAYKAKRAEPQIIPPPDRPLPPASR